MEEKDISISDKVDSAIQKIKKVFEESTDEPSDDSTKKEKSKNNKERFKEVFDELDDLRQIENNAKRQLIDENNMLRILAGLGLVW